MQAKMLSISVDGRALTAAALARLDPLLAGLGDRDAGAVRCMDARANFDVGNGCERVGFLLLVEGLQPPLSALKPIDVVDDPSLSLVAASRSYS